MTDLSLDELDELLDEPEVRKQRTQFVAIMPKQEGPLRLYDSEMRCSNRGCSSPTHFKVQGVARCQMHALNELNNMLIEAGFKGVVNDHAN